MTSRSALPVMFGSCLGALTALACSEETETSPTRRQVDLPADGGRNDGPPGAEDGGTSSDPDASGSDGSTPKPKGPLFAFVGSGDGKIRVFDVDATSGAWTAKKESNAGTNPSFLAIDPVNRRVFSTDEQGNGLVRAFGFDPGTGTLTERNAKSAGGAGTTHVSVHPTGKHVFAANYTGGTMAVLPVASDGSLGDASDTKASGANSHWAGTNPSGTHVFVPALGANVVAQYTLDQANGKLTDNGTAALPQGAGPRHLAFHPTEAWAYVINELAITVTAFSFDKGTGKLTPKGTVSAIPDNQSKQGVSGAAIFVHPSGKFVYASTRGYSTIARFTVNGDGSLTRVDNTPTGSNRPRCFGLDPEGTLLYAGNQDANQVVGFRIDGATGALTSLGAPLSVPSPSFVGLARVP